MLDLENRETRFAIDTVREAALLVKVIQDELVTKALTKEDNSPVTVADFAAQAFSGRQLSLTFPDDLLVGEEDSRSLQIPKQQENLKQITDFVSRIAPEATRERVCAWIDRGNAESGRRYWTVDPIDGTKGFLRGNQYAVALALVVDGQVQIGVLGCPNLADAYKPAYDGPGSLVVAVRGKGTWHTTLEGNQGGFSRLRVSEREDSQQARLMRSFEAGHTNVGKISDLATVLNAQAEPVRMDSQAKYAVMAAGQGEILVRLLSDKRPDYKEKIWDQAAGSLVIEEAGGRVTDLHGKTLDFTAGRTLARNRGVLATNGLLHPAALEALAAIQA